MIPREHSPGGVLRAAARRQRRDLVISALLVAGHQLSEAAVPVVVGLVIDLAVSTGDASALGRGLAVVAGVFVVLAACGYGGYWLAARTVRRAAHECASTWPGGRAPRRRHAAGRRRRRPARRPRP